MSLYNLMFGHNPNDDELLSLLNLTEDDFYRYRDCYLTEDGQIAVYTRAGGGNRECYCRDFGPITEPVIVDEQEHYASCAFVYYTRIRQHPLYATDKDDDFDSTYATVYFKLPSSVQIEANEPQISRDELWRAVHEALLGTTK